MGEKKPLSNLRFADDVALKTEDVKYMEHKFIMVNEESLKLVLRYIKEKLHL